MTHRSEKDYTEVAVNLSVAMASTGADRWSGSPSTPPLDPAETPRSNLPIHLKQ
jgi:hypothetical protein